MIILMTMANGDLKPKQLNNYIIVFLPRVVLLPFPSDERIETVVFIMLSWQIAIIMMAKVISIRNVANGTKYATMI